MTLQQVCASRKTGPRISVAVCLLVVCAVTWGCRTTPVTGRKQLVLFSEAEENQLGLQAYQEVISTEQPSTNRKYVEMVRRVGERIKAVAGRDDFQWEFNVIASDQQNAFCLPGGKVAVYEGIIPICESEAGLAVVMSHEIAHALLRHGGERMSQQKAKDVGGNVVDLAGGWILKDTYQDKREIVQTVYGVGTEYAGILPYSRKHETEADLVGLKLLAKAGYDPSEAPKFWERFASAKTGQQPIEFFSTHPSDARRASDLRTALPEAMTLYNNAPHQYGLGERVATVESTNLTMPLTADTRTR